ncbi:MAG TPA: TadE/TadG family type IV pilus assembly protein [Azospirillum sp.]|nr:TadE/TadG family type IV pilus assembly protein [Azospirillum sp.]
MAMRRLLGDRRGSAAVEFAVILPVFLMIFLGIFEFAGYMWVRNTVQFGAEEAARFAMANLDASTAQVANAARARMTTLDAAKLSVDVQRVVDDGTTFIVVSTTYTQTGGFLSGLFPTDLTTATGRARAPLVQ